MEGVAALFGLLALAMLIGSVLGWVAFFKLSRFERTIRDLESRLARQETQRAAASRASRPASSATEPQPATAFPTPQDTASAIPAGTTRPAATGAPTPPKPAAAAAMSAAASMAAASAAASAPTPPPPPRDTFVDKLIANIRSNWMIWLGGTCVGLAGVFLVTYSIEMGLLGPRARIAAAVVAGLVLHGVAEWLRRREGHSHPAFAALAGGASITLYAAIFAGLVLYSLFGPGTAFALLAVISLLTMALALVHGPVLAIIGILGAYLVPILVSDNSGSIVIALVYALIVTAAALLLIRYVYRPWLWYGTVVGALAWWLISLTTADADGFRGLYLAAFAWLALTIPVFDWDLQRSARNGDPGTEPLRLGPITLDAVSLTVLAIAIAQAISIALSGFDLLNVTPPAIGFELSAALIEWAPLIVVVLIASRQRETIRLVPWVLLVTQWFAWLFSAMSVQPGPLRLGYLALPPQGSLAFLSFALIMAALFSAGAWYAARHRDYDPLKSSLLLLSPVLWLALAYLLVTDLSTSWVWALATLGLGLIYMFVSTLRMQRSTTDQTVIWLTLGAHAAYSLAAAMFLREATLTLALAAQLISLAWLRRRFEVPALGWIIKGVLAVVVLRLTLNPWLLTYPENVHWSLWTYGGSMLCCLIASRLTPVELNLRKWLEAATLHLLVLFLGAEIRWWLYDGRIFVDELTLTETAINAVLWGGLGLSYFYRGRVSETLAHFYLVCSRVLMVLALGAYGLSLTVLNPLFGADEVGSTKIWNLLLLAYGAPVLVALAAYLFYDPRFRKIAAAIAGGGFLIFVSMEIRHLWQGALSLDRATSDAESYTYSATWMVLAAITILAATRFGRKTVYRAGMGLLIVVIAKIFLIDMSDLEGLLRVASFMGLGLALLGLAYLYQRMSRQVV